MTGTPRRTTRTAAGTRGTGRRQSGTNSDRSRARWGLPRRMHGTTLARTHWPSANWLAGTRTLKNWLTWHWTARSWTACTWSGKTLARKLTGRGTRRVRRRRTNGRLINRTWPCLRHNHSRARLRPLRNRPSWNWRLCSWSGWLCRYWCRGLTTGLRLRRRGTRGGRSARGRRTRCWSRCGWRRCRRLRLHRSRDRVCGPWLSGRHNSFGRGRRNGNRFRRRCNRWTRHNRRGSRWLFNCWWSGWPGWSSRR